MSSGDFQHLDCQLKSGVLIVSIAAARIQEMPLAENIQQELFRAVEELGSTRVVVDMRTVRELSSMAFRPLLALRRHLRDHGGQLVLCGLTPPVTEIFRVAKLI